MDNNSAIGLTTPPWDAEVIDRTWLVHMMIGCSILYIWLYILSEDYQTYTTICCRCQLFSNTDSTYTTICCRINCLQTQIHVSSSDSLIINSTTFYCYQLFTNTQIIISTTLYIINYLQTLKSLFQ
jgi:hypothetical protein